MNKPLISLAAALALAVPAIAQEEAETAPSPDQIVDAASADEWISIPAEDLLMMTLAPDAEGNSREVVIQLMPEPFSQGWVENVRLLSRSQYYDGLSVIRVQDNYVTQWGDPAEEENAKPLPDGLQVMAEGEYLSERRRSETDWFKFADGPYAPHHGFFSGWPVAWNAEAMWSNHCYGMVGVARGLSPNTGDGSSLYTVIGHAPRHLDRNIALVGRAIAGMEHLSSLPRGKGALGFYEEDEAERRTQILTVRIASDIAEEDRSRFEYLSTESDSFAKYAEARANRRDPFFIQPAGGADICNIPVPIRQLSPE